MKRNDENSTNVDSVINELQEIRLTQMAKFTSVLKNIKWFHNLANPLDDLEKEISQNYISNIGFPHTNIAVINNVEEVYFIIERPEWNTNWWDAEEQLRSSLLNKALEVIDADELNHAINHATTKAAGFALDSISEKFSEINYTNNFNYQYFINTLTGIAVAITYQASLVLASGGDEKHPFTYKFELIEYGRLPLGITGNTFSVY
ncbi:hypothetical protein OAK17_05805 [Alphaproteobacteria bacterium]|nr:hypothetical protein [Alphaproteobacteria bacterium]